MQAYAVHVRHWRRAHVVAFKIMGVDPSMFVLPLTRSALRGHPYKVLKGPSHDRENTPTFSLMVVIFKNKLSFRLCLLLY